MINEEILSAIDNIDRTSSNSEVCVIESLVNAYDKSFMIMENYENDDLSSFSIFQEGEVLDQVKKEGKKDDNKFVTILLFIPRLIRAFIKSIKPSKDTKKTSKKVKDFSKKFDGLSQSEKEKKVEMLNEQFNGKYEVYIDEKSGKLKFKKSAAQVLSRAGLHLTLVFSTYALFKRIKKNLDVLDPSSLRTFIDDCDKVIHGDDSISKVDLFKGGVDALGDVLSNVFSVTSEISVLGAEIATKLEDIARKDLIKDVPSEKKQEIIKNINEVVARITKINAMVAAGAGTMSMVENLGEMLGDAFTDLEKMNNRHKEAEDYVLKNNPRKPGESMEDYMKHLPDDVNKKMKELEKEEKQQKKDEIAKAKQEHEEEKERRRNK